MIHIHLLDYRKRHELSLQELLLLKIVEEGLMILEVEAGFLLLRYMVQLGILPHSMKVQLHSIPTEIYIVLKGIQSFLQLVVGLISVLVEGF
jgi:hypothetical protein